MARTKYNQTTEDRLQNALDYLEQNPNAKVTVTAKEYGVTREQLRSRLNGHLPLKGLAVSNIKLIYAKEKAICRYIDRLDAINLYVRQEFIVDAANAILKEKAGKNSTPPTIGKH